MRSDLGELFSRLNRLTSSWSLWHQDCLWNLEVTKLRQGQAHQQTFRASALQQGDAAAMRHVLEVGADWQPDEAQMEAAADRCSPDEVHAHR
ncbi:MAG TPA: hypothetical protein VFE24_08745 [Pirellulales bacterium]|nr:hypothetical protein [Pirellulales bacterium]